MKRCCMMGNITISFIILSISMSLCCRANGTHSGNVVHQIGESAMNTIFKELSASKVIQFTDFGALDLILPFVDLSCCAPFPDISRIFEQSEVWVYVLVNCKNNSLMVQQMYTLQIVSVDPHLSNSSRIPSVNRTRKRDRLYSLMINTTLVSLSSKFGGVRSFSLQQFNENPVTTLNLPSYFYGGGGKETVTFVYEGNVPFMDHNAIKSLPMGRRLGLDYIVLKAAAEVHNFSIELIHNEDGQFGSVQKDGSWSGVIGQIHREEADIGGGGISITHDRRGAVSFSSSYYQDRLVIAVAVSGDSSSYFISIFTLGLWLCLLALLLLVTLLLALPRWMRHKSTPFLDIHLETATYLFGNVFGQGQGPSSTEGWSSLIYISFRLVLIVILAIFAGNLTATLAVSKPKWPFSTLQGLADAPGWPVYVVAGTNGHNLLQTSNRPVHRKLLEKAVTFPLTKIPEFVRKMYEGKGVVLANGNSISRVVSDGISDGITKMCDVKTLQEDVQITEGVGLVFPRGSPYHLFFNKIIKRLGEGGIIDKRYQDLMKSPGCGDNSGVRSVSVADISLLTSGIVGPGLFCATLVLIWETFNKRR